MKQKLAIIAAWIHDPKLIIMDEPFVGLDPKAAHLLKGMMRELCDVGGAIFFSTHVLEVAEKLCDKVAIIKGGQAHPLRHDGGGQGRRHVSRTSSWSWRMHHAENASEKTAGGDLPQLFLRRRKRTKCAPGGATIAYIVLYALLMVGLLGGIFTLHVRGPVRPPASRAVWTGCTSLLVGLIAVFLGAFGSVFSTYSSLYLSKDNDLLLSLPIPVRCVMASRLLGVYLHGADVRRGRHRAGA